MQKKPKIVTPPKEELLRAMFASAHYFAVAGNILANPATAFGGAPTIIPSMVHNAFSLEIYMKCLLGLEGVTGKKAWGHNPETLFEALPDATQELLIIGHEMRIMIDPNSPTNLTCEKNGIPKDLRTLLKRSTGFYQDVRYLWEGGRSPGGGFMLWELFHEVRFLILKKRPDWISVYDSNPEWK